ncbi:hypothetical protein BKI52_34380 [marine bacterium AO1-C]|nr:hypothetical protein BKI52_34380 [marine bacterium AO1-C]
MSESIQQELLMVNPQKLFVSKKYKKALQQTVHKFVIKKRLDKSAEKNLLQQTEAFVHSEAGEYVQTHFDPNYHLLLPFFERVVFTYCTKIVNTVIV